jgi:hypothetical protein
MLGLEMMREVGTGHDVASFDEEPDAMEKESAVLSRRDNPFRERLSDV